MLVLVALAACSDVRDFRGSWEGPRVGDAAPLHVGVADVATATLDIDAIDTHGLSGHLVVRDQQPSGPHTVIDADLASLEGAEADVLGGMTFRGSPVRVFLAFVPVADGGDHALAMVSLYDARRVEVRLMRGGAAPIYAIFALAEGSSAP